VNLTKRKVFNYVSLFVNLVVAIMGSIAVSTKIFDNSSAYGVAYGGLDTFRFFTNDGNIFCIIAALVMIYFNIRFIRSNTYEIPKVVYLLKLSSAITGLIIFLVVIAILGPSMGYAMLLSGFYMVVVHILNPILCTLGFAIFEAHPMELNKKELSIGILPAALYGVITLLLVLTKVWVGNDIPYPFLRVYDNPVWVSIFYFIAILGGGYGLSFLVYLWNKKSFKYLIFVQS